MRFFRCIALAIAAFQVEGNLRAGDDHSWFDPQWLVDPNAKPPTSKDLVHDPYFPTPSWFRHHFENASTFTQLEPPVRFSEYVVDGRLELSVANYLDLVLANNPDIAIQKLSINTYRNAITRAFSIFDPIASASFTTTRTSVQSDTLLNGVPLVNSLVQPLTLQYQQTLPTGTQYSVFYSDLKTASNSPYNLYNPELTDSLNVSISQPLLRGRGPFITKLPISIARSRLRAANYSVADQLIQLVANAENAYWDALGARENLRVQEESLQLADAALKRAKRELELGAISPLEIFQPQSNFANAEVGVTQARYQLVEAEDAMRRQMGADLDPKICNLPLVLTATLDPPVDTGKLDAESAVREAFRLRPDLKNAIQNQDVDDLNIKLANNKLKPNLMFTAQYGSSGLGGIYYPRTDLLNPIAPVVPIGGGVGDALVGLFGFGYPVYGFGLTLTLPIRDHAAAADLSDALVQKRMDRYRQRSVEQRIRLEVLTAINQVENSKESIRLAIIARDAAQKRVEADQKRYELGIITLFFVLASQTDYVTAESSLVNQSIAHRHDLITLQQRLGTLLDEHHIVVQ